MDLLYVTPVMPAVTGNGLAMRAGMVLEALAARYRVSVLAVPLYASFAARMPARFRSVAQQCASGHKVARFDIVHVFRLAAIPFAKAYLDEPRRAWLQLDLDDIESRTHRRLAALHRLNGDAKGAANCETEAVRYAVREHEAFRRFDRIFVCSEADRQELQGRATDICVLPNAVDPPETVAPPSGIFRFLFVGSLGYYPNEDAAMHFCKEILPVLRRQAPRPFLVDIAGTRASEHLRKTAADCGARVIGDAPDLRAVYEAAHAIVAPIRAGGGTRIKILEAFSYARPVVSTSAGMEGIPALAGEHFLLGDTPEEFARRCVELMNDASLAERLAANASSLLREGFTSAALKRIIAALPDPPTRSESR